MNKITVEAAVLTPLTIVARPAVGVGRFTKKVSRRVVGVFKEVNSDLKVDLQNHAIDKAGKRADKARAAAEDATAEALKVVG